MIEVVFYPKELKLEVSGHALSGEKGRDLVCCGMSMLFATLAKAIEDSKDQLETLGIIDSEDAPVKMITCKPKEKYVAVIQRTYWTVLEGINLLSEAFKEYVDFKIIEK